MSQDGMLSMMQELSLAGFKLPNDIPQATLGVQQNNLAQLAPPFLLPMWGPSLDNGVANINLTACLLANVSAMYAQQYAYQLQLQQQQQQQLALAPAKAAFVPLKPAELERSASAEDVPIQAAEEVLADEESAPSKTFLSSCCVCKVQLEQQSDIQAHFLSKDHQKQVLEQEQCAVIVTGVPQETALVVIEVLFQGFQLGPDAATYIPAMGDPACEEGLAKAIAQYRPVGDFWHVVLASPEDAQKAAQIPDLSFGKHRLSVELAVKPQHCPTCDVTVQSSPLMEDHRHTHRHQEMFRQHAARCGLSLVGLPPTATRKELEALFDSCEIIEGGYTTETVTKKDWTKSTTVHLVFATEADADAAYDICKSGSPVLGEAVRLLRPSGPKPEEIQAAKAAQEKTAEVRQLVSGLLHTNHIRDVDALSPFLFSRIYYTYVSARPRVLPLLSPRNRFLRDFDEKASKRGVVSLDTALALLQPLEREAASALPEAISKWLWERLLRFCSNSTTVPITRSVFSQIRDLIHNTYQVCDETSRNIEANAAVPEPLTPAPTAVSGAAGPRRRNGPAWKSSSPNGGLHWGPRR